MFAGDFDASQWKLILPDPYNNHNIFVFYLCWCVQFCVGISYVICMIATTSYFICCCIYICGICDHFDLMIEWIKKDLLDKEMTKNKRNPMKNNQSIKQKLVQSIEIHGKIFE